LRRQSKPEAQRTPRHPPKVGRSSNTRHGTKKCSSASAYSPGFVINTSVNRFLQVLLDDSELRELALVLASALPQETGDIVHDALYSFELQKLLGRFAEWRKPVGCGEPTGPRTFLPFLLDDNEVRALAVALAGARPLHTGSAADTLHAGLIEALRQRFGNWRRAMDRRVREIQRFGELRRAGRPRS
jgi:hypothetical protein